MTTEAHASPDAPRPPREEERLDLDALHGYLKGVDARFAERPALTQFPGGHSNLTYLLTWPDGREAVLRRPPLGPVVKSGHDMSREVRFLRALEGVGFDRIPRVLHECEDPDAVGYTFYLMERRRGTVLRRTFPEGFDTSEKTLRAVARAAVDALADLHAVDVEGTGLIALGKPEGYLRRQVEGWTKRWHGAKTQEAPEVEELSSWLGANIPESPAPTVVHNDYKLDNLMLGAAPGYRVDTILDWEMATIGDPLMDLGTSLAYWVEAGDPPALRALGLGVTTIEGNLTREEVVARYEAATGRAVDAAVFYYAYGLFKVGVIAQQIYSRYARGLTRDPRFAALDRAVAALGSAGMRAVRRGRIGGLD